MKGPLVLTQNKNYGDTAPITGETGQIYFIPDEDRYLPITGGRMEGAFCLTEGIGFGNSVPSSGQDGQLYFVPGGSSSGIQAIQLSGQVTGASLVSDGIATITTNFSINKDLSLNTKKITNLGTPTAGNDAATKSYVDSAIANAYNMSSLAEQGIMTLEEPMIGSSQRNYFATIGLDWTRTGDIFYQIVKIPGITINDMPIIDSNISSINPSVIRTQLYDFSNIFRAVTDTDSITFYSLQPSTEKIPIKVMVI